MSRETLSFPVGDHPVVEVTTFAGDIWIDIAPTATIEATLDTDERGYEVRHVGSRVTIAPQTGSFRRFRARDVNLVVPPGTDIVARSTSGDVRIGQVTPKGAALGEVEGVTASGDLRLASVMSDLRCKTASGDLFVDEIGGNLNVATASGDVRVDTVRGDVEINSASGDIHIGTAEGSVGFRTASGDVNVQRLAGPSLRGKLLSGDVRLGIPPRREINLDLNSLAGELHHDLTASGLEPEQRLRIEVSAVSGDLYLHDA
jgi:DUF4097 and DUF4098 domain-containing protein YvlB